MRLLWGDVQIGTRFNDTAFVWTYRAKKNAAGYVVARLGECRVTNAVAKRRVKGRRTEGG